MTRLLAGLVAGSYWATFTIGRIVAGLYAKRVGVNILVQGSLAAALVGALLLIWNPADWVNLLAVALIGFAIAPIFPALMSGTSQRVGMKYAANTIGMQMAASGLGTVMIPSLLGVLARQILAGGDPDLPGGGVPGIVWIVPIIDDPQEVKTGRHIMKNSIIGRYLAISPGRYAGMAARHRPGRCAYRFTGIGPHPRPVCG